MPTIAMEAREKIVELIIEGPDDGTGDDGHNIVDEFMTLLDMKIHEAKDMLLERFEWICSQSPASAKFMYENGLMAGYVPEEGIRSALKHGTLAVG